VLWWVGRRVSESLCVCSVVFGWFGVVCMLVFMYICCGVVGVVV